MESGGSEPSATAAWDLLSEAELHSRLKVGDAVLEPRPAQAPSDRVRKSHEAALRASIRQHTEDTRPPAGQVIEPRYSNHYWPWLGFLWDLGC